MKKLTQLKHEKTEAKITMEELTACLAKQGIMFLLDPQGAFYKVFWIDLKNLVPDTIHSIYDNKALPSSQIYGIVSIIPKAEKDITLIQNWCPLTLLNTLYKFVSSILAFRLKHILTRLLGLHQKVYIPWRYIGEVTRNVHDAFSQAK